MGKMNKENMKSRLSGGFLQLRLNSVETFLITYEIPLDVQEAATVTHKVLSLLVKDCPLGNNATYFHCEFSGCCKSSSEIKQKGT